MIKTILSLSLALTAFLFLNCGSAMAAEGKISVSHKLGAIEVQPNPGRVVVMDFGFLDSIDALKLPVKLAVPKSNLPSYLSQYKDDQYVDIGGLKEFNLETIYAFKPDLIIISGRQQDYYEELTQIAPTYFVEIDSRKYMDDFKRNMGVLGKLFNRDAEVKTLIDELEKRIAEIKEISAAQNRRSLILLTNDGKISVYGSGSRFGIIHDILGLPQADPSIKVGIHGQSVNYEYLSTINPDQIFVVDRSIAVGSRADGVKLLDNELVNQTEAAKNGRIFELDPNTWYLSGGGLESVPMMVEEIHRAVSGQ